MLNWETIRRKTRAANLPFANRPYVKAHGPALDRRSQSAVTRRRLRLDIWRLTLVARLSIAHRDSLKPGLFVSIL